MRWDILHRTEYRYAAPAWDSFNEVRLRPVATQEQVVKRFSLNISPASPVKHYLDFYSNVVHRFEVRDPHERLVIESSVQALTRPPTSTPETATPFPLQRIGEAARSFRCYEFLGASQYVDLEPDTWRLALDAIDGATDTWQAAQALMRFVHGHIAYVPNSTSVHTHMREVLARRQGVCQDFAHVTLGLCRSLKIPALYVSGYLATETASATHAWVEVFVPELGWRGLDPTHNRQVDGNYLKLAIGRDYRDVAPVTGHYKGSRERKMQISVKIQTSE